MAVLHAEYSGNLFNTYHKGTKFYKFLNDDLKHYDFEYKLGLNVDILPFNPIDECSGGGLYFCEESNCHIFWKDYGKKLALIEIPDDARVYVERDKFKADKIIIKDITNFDDVPDSFWINILSKNGYAVHQNGYVLEYVKNQTEEICKLAVQHHGYALKYVKEQFKTEEICKLAVQQYGLALEYVKEQTDKICKLAVQQDGLALQYVKDPFLTEEICKLAVQQNGLAYVYVKNTCEQIIQKYRIRGYGVH